jgi:hypothetical protein
MPTEPVVEDRLVEAHRQLVLGMEAHDGVELLGRLDRRQVQVAHDDALVGHTDPHAAVQLVVAEELGERLGEGLHVGDLAVADDVGIQGRRGDRRDGEIVAVGDRGHGHGTRLDVQPDDGLLGLRGTWHGVPSIDRRAEFFSDLSTRIRHSSRSRSDEREGRSGEGRQVPVDDRLARQQGDDAAQREERAEGHRGLAAELAPRRAMMTPPTATPTTSATRSAGATAAPRNSPGRLQA